MKLHSVSHNLPGDIPVSFPSGKCCNCGSDVGLSMVAEKICSASFIVAQESQTIIKPSLPYCPACISSARRHPTGLGSKILMSLFLSLFLFIALMFSPTFYPRTIIVADPNGFLFPLTFILASGIVFGLFSLKKPTGKQTSHYQPVRLKKVKENSTCEIVGYIFAFTNPEYERDFVAVNKAAISKNVIGIDIA